MSLLRVLVLRDRLLLGSGIRDLLAGEEDMDVRTLHCDDAQEVMDQVEDAQFDVLILDEDACGADPGNLISVFKTRPGLRVIVVSPTTNQVHVYDGNQITVTQAADVINVVRGTRRQW